ncbi:MAG TPA: phage baseplate assembly protein V [Kofleriaceae bacterium]|nr:phage baseplate assembly protein V [Kofleriaceae bacterium]
MKHHHTYRAQALDRKLYGVFTGIVEKNDDPEHEGRVKLSFPWLDDVTITDWCRVLQPYAGPKYGAMFVPEKQSEVLVAFVHGDMNEPVVIGGLYNGDDKPPTYHDGTKQDVKMIRTKAGHVFRLDDSAQARAIELKTAGGHDVVLDDQNKKVTLATSGGHRIEMDDQGMKIAISAKGGQAKVTLDASGNVTIEGVDVQVKAKVLELSGDKVLIG